MNKFFWEKLSLIFIYEYINVHRKKLACILRWGLKMVEYFTRYLEPSISEDLRRKMVFIGGPRQSGKTTLAKHLCRQAGCDLKTRYMNWDAAEDREGIIKELFPTNPGLLILDEIHKYSRWRQVVKGLFDKRGDELCGQYL